MREFIKTLDDLRPEDIRFNFDPLNRNLCFGGGGGGGDPVTKVVKKAESTLSEGGSTLATGATDVLSSGADALQTNLDSATSGINTN